MKRNTAYRITVENESRLQTLADIRVRPLCLWLSAFAFIILLLAIGVALTLFSPLSSLLPENLKSLQQAEQQRILLTIDSLNDVTRRNQAWIDNFLTVSDTEHSVSDSIKYATQTGRYNPDSLPDASPLEKRYISSMEERERFNLSVLAPLDADGMMFSPVSQGAFFTSDSRRSTSPTLILSSDSPVQAVADGTVLATFQESSANGFCILVQHARGFVSAYYHVGNPLVMAGDAISTGQPLAFPPAPDRYNTRWIRLRLWHNGSALIPSDLLN